MVQLWIKHWSIRIPVVQTAWARDLSTSVLNNGLEIVQTIDWPMAMITE